MHAESEPATPTPSPIDSLAARGVWSPVLVPLRPDLSIDAGRFVAHARWLLAQGCHGLALFGTTSGANSFSVSERRALVEEVIGAGIPPERLMVGTGCCALTDSVELTRHAVDAGCGRARSSMPGTPASTTPTRDRRPRPRAGARSIGIREFRPRNTSSPTTATTLHGARVDRP